MVEEGQPKESAQTQQPYSRQEGILWETASFFQSGQCKYSILPTRYIREKKSFMTPISSELLDMK